MGSRARLAVATALLAVLLALPTIAHAAGQDLCTDLATVYWDVDLASVTVNGATVDVPGCADGEPVGIQLITDDGDLPPDGPMMGQAEDGHATFDLTGYAVRVEPVTGIRVFLRVPGNEHPVWVIVVEQRFFNEPGNEQLGLRRSTTLEVPLDGEYAVPGPPTRYDEVRCDQVDTILPPDLVGEGSGIFPATAAGIHVVCYRQQPGVPGGPPDVEDPRVVEEAEVLGEILTRRPGRTGSAFLPSTGADLLVLAWLAIGAVGIGRRLSRR
jgi:hypothetical protein